MKNIHIYGKYAVENIGGRDVEDCWSRDSTVSTWDIRGCGEVVPQEYTSFDAMEINLTGVMYVVYAVNSDGDSFGHYKDAHFEIVWIFDDLQLAKEAIKHIKEHADWYTRTNGWRYKKTPQDAKFTEEYSVEINIGGEKPLKLDTPWNGMFERLEKIDFITCEIMNN